MLCKDNCEKLSKLINTKYIAKKILWFDELESTQKYLKNLIGTNKLDESIVIVADRQTCGYGRYERKWFSPVGGLWFSVLFKLNISPNKISDIVNMSVVSVSNTLDDIIKNTGLTIETKIKPPNDVFINNKKIAGIIIETSILNNNIQWLIMGVGININNDIPVEISDTAISLKDIIKQKTDLVVLLSELLNNLDKNLIVFTDTGIDIFLKEYKRKLIIN